jgi:pyruvate/2-oxoglutarate dehydrogenase complex dihydrolipoamide dehydrogenase (E3) component
MAGREIEFRIAPASQKKRVLIIGGGPAGLETARVAALRGHEVFLYEKENRLGGQLNLACVPSGKAEYLKLLKYYENQIRKLKVSVFHQEATREEIQRMAPEVIVIATGGKPRIEASIRMSSDSLLMAWDVLRGGKIEGEKVVIIGGGQVGCEVADFLLGQGKKITVLEMREKVAADMQERARKILLDQLIRGGVEILAQALVTDILESEIRYETGGLKQRMKNIDQVILALGTASERTLLDRMGEIGVPVFSIGDCVRPRKAIEAIREGFDLALEI